MNCPDEPGPGPARADEALFGTAAAQYARYRPGLPDEAVRLLASVVHGTPEPVLLDLGTGTGQVPLALRSAVPHLTHVALVDTNPGMLATAVTALEPALGACTVSAFAGEAHAFLPQAPKRQRADLVTCCRAFHWMDRPAVLAMADRVSAPHATVAIMGDGSLWTHSAAWTAALRELIQTYLGPDRRAGTQGAYTGPDGSYEDDLAASAFSDVAEHRFPVSRTWTPDTVVGYLRSTSFARPQMFTDRHEKFETQARRLLVAHAHGGVLQEEAVFTVLLARRPGTAS